MTTLGVTTPGERLASAITRLNDRVDNLPSFREATVVSMSPLTVLFDTDTDATPISRSLVNKVQPGDRVLTTHIQQFLWLVGIKGGMPLPIAEDNSFRGTDAEMVALKTSGLAQDGMRFFNTDDSRGYVWRAGAWYDPAAYGMQGQIPSSVAVGSGTASVALDGTVTFTGASSVSLNGVFTGEHDVYEATILLTNSVAGGGVWNRMRAGGVDYSGATYNYVAHYTAVASGPNRYSFFGGTAAPTLNPGLGASIPLIRSKITYFSPARSEAIVQMMAEHVVAASDRYMCFEAADVGGSPYDGFTISSSGGTMSGRIKVVKIG